MIALLPVILALAVPAAHAADAAPAPQPEQPVIPRQRGERVNLDSLKKKYWSHTEDTQIEVVQNRLYSKANKVEVGFFAGSVSSDPFLNVLSGGAHLGFHANEYFAFNLLYWKDSVTPSDALTKFEQANGYSVNTNFPQSMLAGELALSPIYGKLSVFSKSIIYYDLHLSLGAGTRSTESGSYPLMLAGIGQQVYLTRYLSLRVDYRLLRFTEDIKEKVLTETLGQVVATRTAYSGVVTVGMSFLLGLF